MENIEKFSPSLTPQYFGYLGGLLIFILLILCIYYLINIGNLYIDRSKRINLDLKFLARIILFFLVIFILRWIFNRFPIIGSTISALIISAILAYIINPLVTYLQKKSISRRYAVIIVYLGFFLIITILLVFIIPRTIDEIKNFFTSVPIIMDQFTDWVNANSSMWESSLNIDVEKIINTVQTQINDLINSYESEITQQIRSIAISVMGVLGKLVNFVLILIFTYYFTVDKDRLKLIIYKNLPKKYKSDILYLAKKSDSVLMAFVQGKLILAFLVGLATTIMLLILRVNFAIVIGLITMVADIIPYIGPFLGFLPAFLFALLDSPLKAFWVAILFVLLQWAENNIMAPKILGNRVGLPPITILLCIIIGGGMFGVIGMILSVPIFSLILIFKDFIQMKWIDKKNQREEIRKMQ